jgi:imidazoleglycerol phosphate dehydratase HisB
MRTATITRATRETKITCTVNLDGTGDSRIATGIGFLDHMLTALSKHSGIDIDLACTGDLHIDDHHTAEDCALTLGQALDQALASRLGITRFASAYAPLDESLARAVLDLSGRPLAVVNLMLLRDSIGTLATENIPHFFRSLATTLRATLHLDILRGENDHHKAEAAFKAFALALKQAVTRTNSTDVPSTKGSL